MTDRNPNRTAVQADSTTGDDTPTRPFRAVVVALFGPQTGRHHKRTRPGMKTVNDWLGDATLVPAEATR